MSHPQLAIKTKPLIGVIVPNQRTPDRLIPN